LQTVQRPALECGSLIVGNDMNGAPYVQGMFDALIDGVNAESAKGQPKGQVHAVLCVSETFKKTDQMIDVIVEELQRLPKETRKLGAHVVVAQTLLAPNHGFIVPCYP
jgi:hypothetical protein